MSTLRRHLALHWQVHLSWATILALILSASSFGAGLAVAHHLERGGYQPGPLPPPIQIGGSLATISLDYAVTRIHQQGSSNSCVGQTFATIEEITHRLAHPHQWRKFSSGFIWNQLNGGANQGIAYAAAGNLVDEQGDARLAYFPPDGATAYFAQPGPIARAEARHHLFSSWHSIAASDAATITAELRAHHPLAIAIPVTDSYANLWGSTSMPLITAQYGAFHFWHSMTGLGVTPAGVEVLNSWGPQWGFHGRAVLTWPFLVAAGAQIVVPIPRSSHAPLRPHHHHGARKSPGGSFRYGRHQLPVDGRRP